MYGQMVAKAKPHFVARVFCFTLNCFITVNLEIKMNSYPINLPLISLNVTRATPASFLKSTVSTSPPPERRLFSK